MELKVDMLETSVKSDVYQSRFYSKHQPYSLLTPPQNLKNIDPEYDPSDEEWEDEEVDEEHAGERSKCTALDARDIVAMRREIAQEGLRRGAFGLYVLLETMQQRDPHFQVRSLCHAMRPVCHVIYVCMCLYKCVCVSESACDSFHPLSLFLLTFLSMFTHPPPAPARIPHHRRSKKILTSVVSTPDGRRQRTPTPCLRLDDGTAGCAHKGVPGACGGRHQ